MGTKWPPVTLNEESKSKNPLSKEEKAAVAEFFSKYL